MKKKLSILFMLFIMAIIFRVPGNTFAAVQYTDNIIPAMTSDTSPSGIANASGTYNPGFAAYTAFDHKSPNLYAWASPSGTSSGWLSYEFTLPKCITKYAITSRKPINSTSELPKDWTFEAWDDTKGEWVVLDTRTNVTDWTAYVKKEFTFQNSNLYKTYRINISSNGNSSYSVVIGELEMMETIVSAPTNLVATAGNKQVTLKWQAVEGATGYKIYRSTTPGDPNPQVVTGSAITIPYIDTSADLKNGTTYYYTVSAITPDSESPKSVEVSATPTSSSTITGDRAILVISFVKGKDKEYDLSADEIDAFVDWYEAKSDGTGKSYFALPKYSNVKPFISRKEFIKYDNIESFEIKDYNNK